MNSYSIPLWLLIVVLVFFLILILAGVYLFFLWWNQKKLDSVIFLDKNDRWDQKFLKLGKQNYIKKGDKTYYLDKQAGILNRKGKALYLFSIDNPKPIGLSHKGYFDLDPKSLQATLENDMIQKLVKPKSKALDTLLLVGAIAGIIAGASSLILLAMQTGLIK